MAIAAVFANSCAVGQELQPTPRDVYESIPSRKSANSVTQAPISSIPSESSADSATSDAQFSTSADLAPFLPPVGKQVNDDDCVAWAFAYASYSCQICQSRLRSRPDSEYEIFSPAFVYNQLKGTENG